MITNVSLVTVWVTDLDESLAFYTDIFLGLEARDDLTLGEDFRWVTVGHPSQPELDLHRVEFTQEPQDRPYGVEALIRDNSGNWIVLVEAKTFTESDFDGFDPS